MTDSTLRAAVAREVHAWAAAHVALLLGPRATDSATGRRLASLLYQHETHGLSPAPGRPRLLGGTIRTVRPQRPLTGAESSDPAAAGVLRIEPGLLSFGSAPTLPLSIYTTSELAAWLAGPGVAIPGTDPPTYTHLVGRLVDVPGTGLVWPDSPPLASVVDGAYASALYASTAALAVVLCGGWEGRYLGHPAGAYTGPARLWAEACLASGRSLAARLPAGCPATPGALGLVWSEGSGTVPREFWAVGIGEWGCTAWRMGVSALTAPLEEWIRTGALTGLAAHLALLYILADMERIDEPAEGDVVALIEAATMAPGYADGGALAMAGWVWGSGSGGTWPGATVCGGKIDSGQADEAFRTRLVSMAISFAGGAPTAALDVGAGQVFRPDWGHHVFRYRTPGGGLQLLRNARIWPGSDGCDGAAPVLCLYEGASLQVLRYYRSETVTGGSSTTGGGVGMGCSGGTEVVRDAGITVISGGYGMSEPAPLIVGTGSVVTRTLTRAAPGALNWSGGSSQWSGQVGLWDATTFGYNGTSFCNAVYFRGSTIGVGCRKHSSATVTATTSSVSLTSASGVNIALYLPGAPDCLWVVSGGRAGRRATSAISGTKGMAAQTEMHGVEYYSWNYHKADPSYWQDNGLICSDNSPYGHTNAGGTQHNFFVWPFPATQSSEPSTDVNNWSDVACTARIGGVEVDAGTWEDWDSLIGDEIGSDPPSLRIDALVSARSSRAWKAYDTGPWESDSGVSPTALPSAQAWCGV